MFAPFHEVPCTDLLYFKIQSRGHYPSTVLDDYSALHPGLETAPATVAPDIQETLEKALAQNNLDVWGFLLRG